MTAPRSRPLGLRVHTSAAPRPALLRSAIADALAGRAVAGPEGEVARSVATAVERAREGAQRWR